MAERIKRYRPLGVTIPTVPTVDYTAAGRAQARVYQNIARGLDALTDFAFKRAEEKALIEGAEYGAENAPTMQQLRDAGGDIEDVVPGDQTTVFGRAARKAALGSMEVNFEIAARQDLTNLRMLATAENMDSSVFTERTNAIIDGYTSTLQDISPSTALKFRSTMATLGNSALVAHTKNQIKIAEQQREFSALAQADAIVNGLFDADGNKELDSNIEDVFASGSQAATEDQEYIGIADKLELLRFHTQNILSEVGDKASAKSYMKAFDDKVDQMYAANVAEWAATNSIDNLNQWQTGEIEDTRIQDLYNNMTVQQRQLAVEVAQKQIKDRLSTETAVDAQEERIRKQETDNLLLEIFNKRVKGEEYQDSLNKLENINPDEFIKISTEINSAGAFDNASTVTNLTMASVDGTLTMSMVTEAYSDGLLSNPTALSMMDKVKSGRDEQHQEAMKYAKSVLMPRPSAFSFTFSQEDKEAANKVADIERRLILASKANPDINRLDFVRKLVSEQKSDIDANKASAKEAAQKTLDGLKNSKMISENATAQDAINFIMNNDAIDNSLADGLKVLVE